ncbi:MAG: ABC transporter permease [Bacteroidales bacterium]|nr:ABC transporter permease [Bacteroidales bacterium]
MLKMTINRRIRRILSENRSQYIGSFILIVLSSFLFSFMGQFACNFKRLADNFRINNIQEDASFVTSVSLTSLTELESMADAVIEEGLKFDYQLADGLTLRIFSMNEKINLPGIVEGRNVMADGEILLNPVFAESNGFGIGDEIKIHGKSYTITGYLALPNYMYLLQSEVDMMPRPGFGIAVVSRKDFAGFGIGSPFYSVKFNHSPEPLRVRSARLRELIVEKGVEIAEWTNADDNKRINIVDAEVEIISMVSKAVPTAILLLAVIIVSRIVSRLIKRDSTIIGTLYALGYRKREIYFHYLRLPLALAITGSIAGALPGLLPVRAMVSFIFDAFNIPLTEIETDAGRMAASLIIPVLIIVLSSYIVIRSRLRRSPADLLRGRKEKTGINFLERALNLEKVGFTVKFQIREQLRSLSRVTFLLLGIAVATVMMQWGFSLKKSTDFLLTGGVSGIYEFGYEYKFDRLRADPLPYGAEPFSAALFVPPGAEKKDLYVMGVLPASGMLTLTGKSGALLSTDMVIATIPAAKMLNTAEGEPIRVIRKIDGREFTIRVDEIADTYAGNFIFMPVDEYNKMFDMPEGSYNGAFSNVLLDLPADVSHSMVTMEEKMAGVEELLGPTKSMIGFVVFMAAIIGMIIVYLVSSMIVDENTITISLMKIFGYRRKEVSNLVLNSSTMVVVLGYLLGIPLTMSAIGSMIQSLEDSVGLIVPPARISLPYILIGFLVIMLAYEVSKRLSKRKVNAIPMSEALKAGME